jgi:phosphoglycolate phosphatase
MTMTYKLAIFDFDGTLADSFPFFISVFNTIADQHGFRRIDLARVDSLRHYSTREMMKHVGMPAWKLPLASKTFMAMMKDSADGIRVFDGIGDALRALAVGGMQLAVVSSNSEHNVRRVLGTELAALVGQFECGMSIPMLCSTSTRARSRAACCGSGSTGCRARCSSLPRSRSS